MVTIRLAKLQDCQAIHDLIVELAIFEKAVEKVVNSTEHLRKDGFGEHPLFICFVAESNANIIGISFCYVRYSTWIGKVLYLEDLLVTENERNKGVGKMLMEFTLAYGRSNQFKRIGWQVLDWNESAINFYKKFGAGFDGEWLNSWIDL